MAKPINEVTTELKGLQKEFNKIECRINKLKAIEKQYSTIAKYIGKYLFLIDSDFKTQLEQELHEDGIIFYKRLQNLLGNLATFRRDEKGATFALKRTLAMFLEQGFLIEMDSGEMKATYGTEQRAFKIVT